MYEREFEAAGFQYQAGKGGMCWYNCINWIGIYGDCYFYHADATLNVKIVKLGVSVTYPASELLTADAKQIVEFCKNKVADAWRTAYR